MDLRLFGISHKTANLEQRESFVINKSHYKILIGLLETKFSNSIESLFCLSTCNRTEFYIFGENGSNNALFNEVYQQLDCKLDTANHFYFKDGLDALNHMCLVAIGAESRIIGEQEVFGQFKRAGLDFIELNLLKGSLQQFFNMVINIAKEVRTKSKISINPLSVSSIVIKLLKEIFEKPSDLSILLIGAGEVAQGILKGFHDIGINNINFLNRSKKILKISTTTTLESKSLNLLSQYLKSSDILISTVTTNLPVIGKGLVEEATLLRRNKPMLLIDLGVPRNIENSIKQIENAYLYTLEDIEEFSDNNMRSRQDASIEAINITEALSKKAFDNYKILSLKSDLFHLLFDLILHKDPNLRNILLKVKNPSKELKCYIKRDQDLLHNLDKLIELEDYTLNSMIKEVLDAS